MSFKAVSGFRQWFLLVFLSLILVAVVGCGGGGDGDGGVVTSLTGTNGQPGTVAETRSATITAAGGELPLSDGTTLVVPANTVAGDVQVSLSKMTKMAAYSDKYQTIVDLKAGTPLASLSFRIPMPAGRKPDGVVVAYEDPVTRDCAIIGASTEVINGSCTVTLSPNVIGSSLRGQKIVSMGNGVYIIELADTPQPGTTPLQNKFVMKMPYYEQDGGNCWAVTNLMFSKGYNTNPTYPATYRILRELGIGRDDGIASNRLTGWYWNGLLGECTQRQINRTTESKRFFTMNAMIAYVTEALMANRPVQVNMIQHQALFLGYELIPNTAATYSYDFAFLMHDPNNAEDQLPYMRMTPNEIYSRHSGHSKSVTGVLSNLGIGLISGYAAVSCTEPVPANRVLQTIHLPDVARNAGNEPEPGYTNYRGAEFRRNFGKINNKTAASVTDYLMWDHAADGGLRQAQKEVPTFEEFSISNVPVTNMDDVSVDLTVETKVSAVPTSGAAGSERLIATDLKTITVGASSINRHSVKFAAGAFKNKIADSESRFKAEMILKKGGETVDSFSATFIYRPFRIEQTATTVDVGRTATFTAFLQGQKLATGVTWKIEEADGGTIASDGTYSPPAKTGVYHIRATYADAIGTKFEIASITVENKLAAKFEESLKACTSCEVTSFQATAKFLYPPDLSGGKETFEWRTMDFKVPDTLPANRSKVTCIWNGASFSVLDAFAEGSLNYAYSINGTVDFAKLTASGEAEWKVTDTIHEKSWKVKFSNLPLLNQNRSIDEPEQWGFFQFYTYGNKDGAVLDLPQGKVWWGTSELYGEIKAFDATGVEITQSKNKTQVPNLALSFSK